MSSEGNCYFSYCMFDFVGIGLRILWLFQTCSEHSWRLLMIVSYLEGNGFSIDYEEPKVDSPYSIQQFVMLSGNGRFAYYYLGVHPLSCSKTTYLNRRELRFVSCWKCYNRPWQYYYNSSLEVDFHIWLHLQYLLNPVFVLHLLVPIMVKLYWVSK